MMVSRWAFEALAVKQFRDNRYMSPFFGLEQEMARSKFISDLLTTELTGQIDLVSGWQNLNKPGDTIASKLNIIRNELVELDEINALPPFRYTDRLVPALFSLEVADSAKAHLAQIKQHFNSVYRENNDRKDILINQINKQYGTGWLYDQKMKYHNKSLENMMLKTETREFFRYTPNGIMQKVAPVYKVPDFRNGRAHFLASSKNFYGMMVDTFWFNIAFIAFLCLFLYVALYYDWLRKILSLSSVLKFRRKKRNE
jgi:hypothetical protein